MVHRNTEGLSDLGKRVIESCENAYVNDLGQVIDPCHAYWGDAQDATSWMPVQSAFDEELARIMASAALAGGGRYSVMDMKAAIRAMRNAGYTITPTSPPSQREGV